MEINVLGELEVVAAGIPVKVRGSKQRALLAFLALQRGRAVSPERLIDELWGEGEVANPANALQAQIGQLRRTLGAATVVTSKAGYSLAIGPDDLDAGRFEQMVTEGRRLRADGEMAQASAVLSSGYTRRSLSLRPRSAQHTAMPDPGLVSDS